MKKTSFPLKQSFEQDFITSSGETLFTLKYDQATMTEYHKFFDMKTEEQMLSVYKMIKAQIPLTIFEKIISKIFKGFCGKVERSLDIPNIIANVLANKFRTYESVYTEINDRKQKEGSSPLSTESLFSANLSRVCQKYCVSPHELFDKYTLEQFIWLQDGIIFNMNVESGKEGQMENHIALVDRDAVKKRSEETRKAFEEIENRNK